MTTPDPTAPTPDAALVERLREAVCECGHRAFDHDTGGCKFRAIYHCRPGEDPCPCGKSTTEALAPTVAAIRDAAVAEAVGRELSGFTAWVSRARAYNGSPFAHGQSLYNECLNGVLSNWAGEYLSEAAGADLSADEPLPRVPGPSDPRKAAQ